MDKTKELRDCNFAKTILMLLVIVYHSALFWRGGWFINAPAQESASLAVFSNFLISFLLQAFVIVSGYIFFFLRIEQRKYVHFPSFLKNKCKRLIVPYLFVAVIYVIPITQAFFKYRISDLLWKYALGVSPSQLWFLLMLFGLFLMFYPLSFF